MKTIINLYILKGDENIHSYNLTVTGSHSIAVLTCLKTFCLSVRFDSKNGFKLLDEVYVTAWHAIMMFIFAKG
jgi:hypothetical protein